MGWLSWLGVPAAEVKSASPATLDEVLRDLLGQANSKAGQLVNLQTAMEVAAVFGCARVIAEGIAQVPCRVYQRREDGGRRVARDHPLFELVSLRPNAWQTSFEFRETLGLHLALTHNAFVFINRSRSGEVIELLPYEPGSVTVTRNSDMTLAYTISLANGGRVAVPTENMWHLRGPSWNSWQGLNAVHLARNVIGLQLATEEFGSSLFKNGGRPGGVLSTQSPLTEEQIKDLRKQWQATHEGSGNAMKTALLTGGLTYSALSFNAKDSEFTETQKRAVRGICAVMRVQPMMIMESEGTAAYASVEQQLISHVTNTMMPWYERYDQSSSVNLLSREERRAGYYVKLDAKGLMRGPAKERAEYYQIMLQNGVYSRNEVRDLEDEDRVDDPDFDVPRQAANLYGPKGQLPTE